MKRLFLGMLMLGMLLAAGRTVVLPGQVYLKGTVSHVLEHYADDTERLLRQVKIRLRRTPGSKKEFVVIEMPAGTELSVGDKLLLRRTGGDNYGLNSSVDDGLAFWDFAREGSVVSLLVLLAFSLLLTNKRNWRYPAAIVANIFLLGFVLPFWLSRHLPPSWFTLVFCLFNTGVAYYLLPSRKIFPAAVASLLGSSGAGLLYAWLIHKYQLRPLEFLQADLGNFFAFPRYLDAHLLVIMSFYLCLFVIIFLLKVSCRNAVYENIRWFFFRLVQLFSFLAAGLLLPFLLFFQLSNLELDYLLNYEPFVYLFCKLFLCLLAIQFSCIIYVVYYYNQNKPTFARHAALRELKTAPASKLVMLQKILQEQGAEALTVPRKKPRKKGKKK
ncbi:hypothetical protein NO2_0968 [Candidatus Termititenax persephonae]|uniref:Uncharacterized protein n=1 Tax=Candidatus Termititenax persephonae TaxID=2218525 RepID=A0A388TGZ5_9BACT|nr:hypothetical protein NO2_0968 [Candidatus Termititenax persephonae]